MGFDSTLDLFARLPAGSQSVETSEAAADKLERSGRLAALRWNVLLYVASRGEAGATADEVEAAFNRGHNSTSPRLTDLLDMEYLERFDGSKRRDGSERPYLRRKTRQGGSGFVHIVTSAGRAVLARKRSAA